MKNEQEQDWVLELEKVMARLRDPDGCPWDREQDHKSLRKYLVEECAEVVDAIDLGDMHELKDELGDVLMNLVFHAQIAKENNEFTFQDVAQNITEKMIRRHPHVFGDQSAETSADVNEIWAEVKATEKSDKGKRSSVLDGVPHSLPSLYRAQSVQKKAAKVGFDWPDWRGSFDKIEEELAEFREELEKGTDRDRMEEEFGDLMFSMVNLARSQKFQADDAMRGALQKFERRFRAIEDKIDGQFQDFDLKQLDQIWDQVKSEEK